MPAIPDSLGLESVAAAGGEPTGRDRQARVLGRLWSALIAAVLAVAVGAALGRPPLNVYDVSFSLDWGSDLVHGSCPTCESPARPLRTRCRSSRVLWPHCRALRR